MIPLTIYEQLFLLLLKDKEGTIQYGIAYQYGLAGAILAELLLSGHIRLEKKRWGMFVVPQMVSLPEDTLLNECYQKIANRKRHGALKNWVTRFAGLKHLKSRIGKQLVRKGILREEEDRIMLLFKRKIYPEVNPEPEKILIASLHKAVENMESADRKTVVLLSLLNQLNALKFVFPKPDVKAVKKRIKEMICMEPAGKATGQAIEEMQIAILVGAIMPAVIASNSVNS